MIDDIVFDENVDFLLEIPDGNAGGVIASYSLDGSNYDFTSVVSNPTIISTEHSYIFIN